MAHAASSPWWQHAVIYQIYPRSFRDASGDGVGDLRGILEKLDYLHDVLGVDAIWLSPFYPSPMADFGYDVSDYTDVDPLFGDLATFDVLVAEVHARGLRVVVDYVPNHTSDQHAWFRESRSSRSNPRRDWYVWRDARPDGSPPNNWLSIFGGPSWEWDTVTGQYYLHSFLREQPDLNWRNPEVRDAMYDVLRFWLRRGVDGVRIDAIRRVMKDPELRDNPPNESERGFLHKATGEYDRQLHVYDNAHPDLHGVLRDIRRVLEELSSPGHERVSIGEIHVYDPVQLSRYYGEALDELHLPFNFGLLPVPWEAQAVRGAIDRYEAAVPGGGWPNYVLGNHDEPRIASRIGREQARVAMMLLLTLRGTPTLYYGDELEMKDVPVPSELAQDPWGKNVGLGLGRDPARTPMQWAPGPNAGFCLPGVRPWLPVAADADRYNVEVERQDAHSMLNLTRRLLKLRHDSAALREGRYRPLEGEGIPAECYVYMREASGERLVVALNFSAEARCVYLPEPVEVEALLSTRVDREGPERLDRLDLRADEGLVLRVRTEWRVVANEASVRQERAPER